MGGTLAELLEKRRKQQEDAELRDEGFYMDTYQPPKATQNTVEKHVGEPCQPASSPVASQKHLPSTRRTMQILPDTVLGKEEFTVEPAKAIHIVSAVKQNDPFSILFPTDVEPELPDSEQFLPKLQADIEKSSLLISGDHFPFVSTEPQSEIIQAPCSDIPAAPISISEFRLSAPSSGSASSNHQGLGTGSLFKRPTPAELLRGKNPKKKSENKEATPVSESNVRADDARTGTSDSKLERSNGIYTDEISFVGHAQALQGVTGQQKQASNRLHESLSQTAGATIVGHAQALQGIAVQENQPSNSKRVKDEGAHQRVDASNSLAQIPSNKVAQPLSQRNVVSLQDIQLSTLLEKESFLSPEPVDASKAGQHTLHENKANTPLQISKSLEAKQSKDISSEKESKVPQKMERSLQEHTAKARDRAGPTDAISETAPESESNASINSESLATEAANLNTIQIGILGTIDEAEEQELDEDGREIFPHRQLQGPESDLREPVSNESKFRATNSPQPSTNKDVNGKMSSDFSVNAPKSAPKYQISAKTIQLNASKSEMGALSLIAASIVPTSSNISAAKEEPLDKISPNSLLKSFASEYSGVLQQHLHVHKSDRKSSDSSGEEVLSTDDRSTESSSRRSSETNSNFKMSAVIIARPVPAEELGGTLEELDRERVEKLKQWQADNVSSSQNGSRSETSKTSTDTLSAPLTSSSDKHFRWSEMATDRTKDIAKLLDCADERGDDYIQLQLKKGVQDVISWLRSSGWGQYEEMFAVNQIDFEELQILEDEDLIDMGMKRAENRSLLLKSIRGLRGVLPDSAMKNGNEPPSKEKQQQRVWLKSTRDKNAEQSAGLLASATDYKQKHGSVTWKLEHSKSWKRGFCVLQGTMLAIFERSDYVVNKPEYSFRLPGSVSKIDTEIENGIYIQINPAAKGPNDIRVVSKTEEERDEWMEQFITAAHLAILNPNAQVIVEEKETAQVSTILLLTQEIVINNSGPLEDAFLSMSLTTSQCIIVHRFDKISMPLKIMMPNQDGVVSATFKVHNLVGNQLLKAAGKDALLFFEFGHTERTRLSSAHVQLQYWAFTPLEAAHSGTVILPLIKRPLIMDPDGLKKSLPIKRKSYITFRKEVKERAQNPATSQSTLQPQSGKVRQPRTSESPAMPSSSTGHHSGPSSSVSAPSSTGSERRSYDSRGFNQDSDETSRSGQVESWHHDRRSRQADTTTELRRIVRNTRISVQVREAANTLMRFLATEEAGDIELDSENSFISFRPVDQDSRRTSTNTSTTAPESEKSAKETPPVSNIKELASGSSKPGLKYSEPMSAFRKMDQKLAIQLGERGTPLWGNCYGGLGEPVKGQKHGWLVVVLEGRKEMRLYAKCSRNTLLLFQSPDTMDTAIKSICLDGALINPNSVRREFGIEIMKSMFANKQDDVFVVAESQKEAESWEKALLKGSLWNAKQTQLAQGSSNGREDAKIPMTTTPEEIARMNETIKHAVVGGTTPGTVAFPKPMPRLEKGEEVDVRFLQLNHEVLRKGEAYLCPVIGCYWVGYDGSRMRTPEIAGRDVEILSSGVTLPGIMKIDVSRKFYLSPDMRKTSNIALYFEFKHQKPKKVSIRAWTFLPLSKMRLGDYNLMMYEKPVVHGPRAEKADIMKGFQLSFSIRAGS